MNPAREALTRAVNRAIEQGAPIYVNQGSEHKMLYVKNPTSSLDSISGALGLIRREWGDYGYSMSIEGRGLYGVRHFDGSEFFIYSDRYGNARQVEWNGEEWV